jgi:prevent-host-death family protein
MADQEKSQPRPPQKIGVREFRGNFSGFMRQVRHGSSFEVTSRDKVVAVVQPPQSPEPPRRRPGTMRGQIVMAPDFNETSPELIALMEGNGE